MIKEDGKESEIESNYSKIPNVENKIVIIVDPMPATGSTIRYLLRSIEKSDQNPNKIIIFCAIASKYGSRQIEEIYPKVEILSLQLMIF